MYHTVPSSLFDEKYTNLNNLVRRLEQDRIQHLKTELPTERHEPLVVAATLLLRYWKVPILITPNELCRGHKKFVYHLGTPPNTLREHVTAPQHMSAVQKLFELHQCTQTHKDVFELVAGNALQHLRSACVH